MWRKISLLILCCTVSGLDARQETERSAEKVQTGEAELGNQEGSLRGGGQRSSGTGNLGVGAEDSVQQPMSEPLEDELNNQENIISQLLGDYDKVKTVSSGSDCVCRCVVRPIKRSDCSRIHDGGPTSLHQDFYTVETVTRGTDCKKCVCMAPPSAVNPCEGEYRFKKLQEASKDDIKLATIMDLLEGSMYGMDLLKLHSVTTNLLAKMDNMEKAFSHNFTEKAREKEHVKDRPKEKEKEKKTQQKKKKGSDLERAGQKSGASAFANKQKHYDSQLKKNQQQDGLEQQQPAKNKTGSQKPVKEKTEPRQPIKDKNSMVIRGVTFYKAEEVGYKAEERGRGKNTTRTVNTFVDSLISDQFSSTKTFPIQSTGPKTTISTVSDSKDLSQRPTSPSPTQQPTAPPTTTQQITTTTKPAPTTVNPVTELTTTTTAEPTTIKSATTSQTTTAKATVQPATPVAQHTTSVSPTVTGPKSRLSWTESPVDQPKTTKKPALCKDTVASISEPVQHNSYGLSDGAWMRDARGHGNIIYLTNGHYGSNLLEFRDMDAFKSGQAYNSYKLPYSFTGTGHVVFNGAFYYNRAFSRDVIRYDLRHRYVAAWTTLHDALLEEQVHRTQTEVQFAVDESGLWLMYPALDTEGFHQEVILLNHLRHQDLQPIRSFRTGLRRGRYGNSFLVCGVLYAVDSMERRYANVTYAFDTHTLTHTVPSLAFTNMHAHTSQLAYCPLDKKLYAWDNGHQMMYDVIFAY
ncbi:olfactomedin-like protein 2B [Mastacembelus armatus]|uniref:olfactomedin-like protein 2B n=1 Tax=Mastacembelus armatus TaxID=205130 RepID=UPI000E454BD2|nr:olfactomedin-like protein 2B [Mastacembelus armatus]XP_026168567.1 olfactomedin-like protein 2B [Mastacembelus armatus]